MNDIPTAPDVKDEAIYSKAEADVKYKVKAEAARYLSKPNVEHDAWTMRCNGLDVYLVFERLAALTITGDTLGALKYIQTLLTESEIEEKVEDARWE